ncbi:MAG: xanthine dehydrogenase family protein molybdopterin-binding subunit [Nitratireductor sp.]
MNASGDIGQARPRWLGRSLPRVEDRRLVTGAGAYVDDHLPDGCLHLEFVRSPYPHGRLGPLELEEARSAEGVVAVFCAADLGELGQTAVNIVLPDMTARPLRLLAGEAVEAAGEAVAAVVATSRAAARDAAALVAFDVEPLAVTPPREGVERVAADRVVGDIDDAFSRAAVVVEAIVEHALVAPTALEPRAALADWNDGALTAWLSTQSPYRAREDLARVLGLTMGQVRVIAPDVGGAFGGKSSIYPEELVVAWAARKLARPVKWCATRGEDLIAASHGRGARTEGALALDADGRLLGLKARLAFPLGHWMPYSAAIPVRNAGRILPGPYKVGAVAVSLKALDGNHAGVGIYRGAGRPEAAMLMERLMDEAARRLSIDPVEIRRRNLVGPADFPWPMPAGDALDSGDYPALLDRMARLSDYQALRAACEKRRATGQVVGLGVALYVEPCGQGWESASVSLCRDGAIQVATGASAQGQGRQTAFSQIVADALDLDPSQVGVGYGDTADLPGGIGALASRSTAIGGSAVLRACEGLRAQIVEAGGERLNCAAADVALSSEGLSTAGSKTVSWRDFAHHVGGAAGDPAEPVLTSQVIYHADNEAWSSGCCLAMIAIDPDSGRLEFEKLAWVDDAGTVVNPLLVRGQLVGGMAQGVGEALMERIVYDEEGQLVTGSLMDYAVPRAADVPLVDIDKLETPSPVNALGAKGVGEAGCIGIPAAIANAVGDALAASGATLPQMPFTSEKLWCALHEAGVLRNRSGQP